MFANYLNENFKIQKWDLSTLTMYLVCDTKELWRDFGITKWKNKFWEYSLKILRNNGTTLVDMWSIRTMLEKNSLSDYSHSPKYNHAGCFWAWEKKERNLKSIPRLYCGLRLWSSIWHQVMFLTELFESHWTLTQNAIFLYIP